MSTHVGKSERLVNLVIALLSTRQYLPVATIRATVLGYDRSGSDEAFGRMFEQKKIGLDRFAARGGKICSTMGI